MNFRISFIGLLIAFGPLGFLAAEPLHKRIDDAVQTGFKGPHAKVASDEDFLRRIYLDLTGIIPSADQARTFLKDKTKDKRAKLIDSLLQSPEYPRRMMEAFTVMFEERRDTPDTKTADWEDYLVQSFAENKPWDQLAREMLAADTQDPKLQAANKFYMDRAGDLHLITKDVGRLFLGRDIECARCHDHPQVKDYLQRDYFGLYTFLNRSFLAKKKGEQKYFAEKALPGVMDFESVFTMEKMKTGPHLPGEPEIKEPTFDKGEEYLEKPNPKAGVVGLPKYSPRELLAKKMTDPGHSAFVRNAANRIWFLMAGRGVIHPLDMIHSENPPVQEKLLDVLSEGLVELKFDVRAFLKEIALSQTYQRSSLLPGKADEIPQGTFAVAELRPLSPEQLTYSLAQATENLASRFEKAEKALEKSDPKNFEAKRREPLWRANTLRSQMATTLAVFTASFGSRKGEPETEFQAALSGALCLSNDRQVISWLKLDPMTPNLTSRLAKLESTDEIAEELYLSVLTRYPSPEETTEVSSHLRKRSDDRPLALQELIWALVASTEFRLNH